MAAENVDNSGKAPNSSLGYVIAACVLGAAVGNMFVARRLRSFSKMKSPYKEQKYNSNNNGNSSSSSSSSSSSNNNSSSGSGPEGAYSAQQQQARARMSEEEIRREQRYKEHNYHQDQQEKVRQQYDAWQKKKMSMPADGVGGYMRSQLVVLEMDQFKRPTEKEVKEAYRKYAMTHHPDRLPLGDPKRKKKEEMFSQATSAYKILLDLMGKP